MFLVVQTGTIAAVAVAFAKFLGVVVAGRLRGQEVLGSGCFLFPRSSWTASP